MKAIRDIWDNGFSKKPAAGFEILLIGFLFVAIRRSLRSLTMSEAMFRSADLFAPGVVGFQSVGWAAWLPDDVVISFNFQRFVAAVTLFSAVAWLLKRLLPGSAILCALSFGLLVSLDQSRMFNYTHRFLVPVWVFCVFALAYTLRHREFRQTYRAGSFWIQPIYPVWTGWLLIVYLGIQYSVSGIYKLWLGGWDAGSGLKLQILIYRANSTFDELREVSALTQILLDNRLLANLAMTSAVIFEAGAIVGLLYARIRPWWALSLIGFHVSIIVTMHIPFYFNVVLLLWLALPIQALIDRTRGTICDFTSPITQRLCASSIARWLYPIDVFGLLSMAARSPSSAGDNVTSPNCTGPLRSMQPDDSRPFGESSVNLGTAERPIRDQTE